MSGPVVVKSTRTADTVFGVAFIGLIVLGLLVAALVYDRAFVSSTEVRLTTGSVGNAMQKGSDVKLNGVPVGVVEDIESTADGAVLTLSLKPSVAEKLPSDTVARLLPKTLFGERYVQLLADGATSGDGLAAGDTIRQDASDEAIELEQVLDELLPVLEALQPQKLSAALGELSLLLSGRGADIGESMELWGTYLTQLQPYVPQLADDLVKLGQVARTYEVAAPDLLEALDDLTVTANTMVEEQETLTTLFANVVTASNTTRDWLQVNQGTIITLSAESRSALAAAAPYATQFPCLFKAVADFVPTMDTVLGKDSAEPGIHVTLNVVPTRGAYAYGPDNPQFSRGGQARCPYQSSAAGSPAPAPAADTPPVVAPPPSPLVAAQVADAMGLGEVNSPAENQLIAELLAGGRGLAPDDYPAWSSLLLGPALRGTVVTVQ
ncbi:MCE family protein [Aeromicrobium sp. Leaf350]|uniref:MCE family protein n=1 Tax=Aeromicrobium sp. Leaf350 TaxID=2876565 RepID=UPI001E58FD64|nr:MCE family protein [Aeromicrobium sp. Leaf350]